MTCAVYCVPLLQDNYCWMIGSRQHPKVLILDPGDSAPVARFLTENHLTPVAIILTHKHPDHTMGIEALKTLYQLPVYGPFGPGYSEIEHILRGGENLHIIEDIVLKVVHTPGHIDNHLCYFLPDSPARLFCGDTLFSAGCGRLLGGTAEQLKSSLDWIKTLPDDTLIYCSHEYTLANLGFAEAAEPDNSAIGKKIRKVNTLRLNQKPSLPSTLAAEKTFNPFLRCDQASIIRAVKTRFGLEKEDEQTIFTHLRLWKDRF